VEIKQLEAKAKKMRRDVIQMLEKAGSGHPGGSLSSTEILTCLFFKVMRHNPQDPKWPDRDRFHLSKGHCCPIWYAVLAECGYFPKEELSRLRKLGALLQGHPDVHVPGIDVASGSLGQGLSVTLGMALSGRIDKRAYRVYCLLGDGELQEGNVWEAAMACAHFRMDTICAIVDHNGFQIDGRVQDVMGLEPLADKWKAFGWQVISVDGHNIAQLLAAFEEAQKTKGNPTVIIAKTIKGKDVSFMENVVDFHGRAPTKQEAAIALKELSDGK